MIFAVRSAALAAIAFAFALAALVAAPVAAHAQENTPVVVVIESGDVRVDAARIRSAMQRELGIPVISILEALNRSTYGTVSVALTDRGRRAAIGFLPSDGTRFAVLVEVRATSPTDLHGEWLVAPCASAVRTSMQRRAAAASTPEVIDPWLASHVVDDSGRPHEVIDPWVGEPRRQVRVSVDEYYLGDDIIDPWAAAVSNYQAEQAARLARPRRTRATPAARPNTRRTPPARTP